MKIVALHGFLGRPHDWTNLFQDHPLKNFLDAKDVFSDDILEMKEWAASFNKKNLSGNESIQDKPTLLGYSLGGRLALHALINCPKLWSAAVIVSAHLGISQPVEKDGRKNTDEEWAKRFESEPWEELMHHWNARETFKGDSFCFERHEKDYSRLTLAAALRTWSSSRQEDLREHVAKLEMPILWVAGGEDLYYAKQAERLSFAHPLSEIWIVPKSGHRVPWQVPEQFLLKITHFFNNSI